jgi:CBS domain-containing protein
MSNDFLDDEQQIANEQANDELMEKHALRMPISELPELQEVVKLAPSATIRVAIDNMVNKRVGCILMTEDEQIVGVFSERDVLRKIAGQNIDVDTTPVSEVMTRNPQTLSKSAPLVYALHQMSNGGYRHIPLTDENGHPVAVVSMRDIVEYIVSMYPEEIMNLPANPDQSITSTREGA